MTLGDFFSGVLEIEDTLLIQDLCEISKIVEPKKGELLIRIGEEQKGLLFLIEGICRGYFVAEDGREVTDSFIHRCGTPMMTGHAIDGAAVVNLIAETDVKCVRVEVQPLMRRLSESAILMRLQNQMFMKSLEEQVKMKHVMCFERAKARYLWFLDNYEGLIDVVRHKDIASFLGIEPESLSRIRKQLAAKP